MNWLITIPKTIAWSDYQKEIDAVANGDNMMNYRVRYFPKEMCILDRCYILHDGQVRGWMNIVGMKEFPLSWRCSTSGIEWAAGKYIQRSGPFTPIDGPKMQGFRGVRKYEQDN